MNPPLQPVIKPEAIRELGPVDLSELKPLVLRLSQQVWNREDARKENAYAPFEHTKHIVFRFIRDNLDPRDFYSDPSWEIWRPRLEPLFRKIVQPYQFAQPEFPKAMFARLASGQVIDSHKDGPGSHPLTHKIHVPIQTNPQALITVDRVTTHLAEGVAYELNNLAAHAAENRGETDRIHLIFEVFDQAAGAQSTGVA